MPLSGLDVEIVRTYDSRDKVVGDFGVGWRLDVRQGSYRNNRPPGAGWQILSGTFPCTSAQPSLSHLTTIRLSDAEIYRFALVLDNPAATIGGCFAQAGFAFVDGPVPGSASMDRTISRALRRISLGSRPLQAGSGLSLSSSSSA